MKSAIIFILNFCFVVMAQAKESAQPSVSIRPRLGDRFFVMAALKDVFGPECEDTLMKYVFAQASVFSGPCDIYESIRTGQTDKDFVDIKDSCPGGKLSVTLPMIGNYTLMRQGFIDKTCSSLISNRKTVGFALKKIFHNAVPSNPDKQKLLLAFQLFYRERTPSEKVLTSLQKVGANSKTTADRWASILKTLCEDPGWQVL